MWLIMRRIRALLGRRRLERDMDDEMRLHLELEAEELIRNGVAPQEAHRRARLAFGGVERFKEEGRDARGVRWTEDLGRDARLGVRQMRRSVGFTIAALITLALGIGATTAMASMAHAILVDPLPFVDGDRLVVFAQCGGCQRMAIGNYVTLRDEMRTLQSAAAMGPSSPILRGADRTEVLDGSRVTVEFFTLAGVHALLGRTFAPGDTVAGQQRVAMIGEATWRSRFGADSTVVGRTITLDGAPATVIGVVPARSAFPATTEIWTLLPIDVKAIADRYWTDYTVIGRMRAGATIADVRAELRAIAGRLAIAFPDAMKRQRFTVKPSRAWNDQVLLPITVFMTAVALVLVIACTNLAGLLLARLTAREREIAVRAAMGAAGERIARQLLTETLLLSVTGGLLGAITAWVMIESLRGVVPADAIAGWTNIGMSWTALAVSLGLGIMTGAVIGVGPALRFSRPDLVQALKDGVRATAGGRGARARRALVVAQVAFSIMLLVAAGLLTRTAVNLYRADIGVRTDHVLTMRLRYPPSVDSTRRRPPDFYDRLTVNIEAIPGVVGAGTVSWVPFTGFTSFGFEIEGRPPLAPADRPWARMQAVTAGYFDVMRIHVARGRAFDANDVAGAPRVVVISESAARRLFDEKGDDPIGRALLMEGQRYEIVGVSRDVHHFGANTGGLFEVYYLQAQWPHNSATLAVRTAGDPADATAAVTRAVHAFDPDVAINRVATMPAVAGEYLARYRVMAGLMIGFAVIALLISAIGLYGVISFAVAQRTREFGIRLALGAGQRDLLRLVLGDGVRLAAIGVAIGLVGAAGLTQAMRSLLYGVAPVDPIVLVAVTFTLGTLAVGTSFVPARRATRVDPMTSLRAE